MAGLIDSYLATVEALLAVDRKLFSRVRDDIEEQFWGLVDDRHLPLPEAERRVIGGFGDASELARAYLRAAWPAHFQRNMLISGFLIAMSLLCMRLRALGPDAPPGIWAQFLLLADASSFALAVLAAGAAWRTARTDKSAAAAARTRKWLNAAVLGVALSTAASLARVISGRPPSPTNWHDWILIASAVTELGLLVLAMACLHHLSRYCRAMA